MLFGKRDKKNQSNERVLNLKARVDALRQADEASRKRNEPVSLDHFLEGDDVLTGREVEDNYQPTGFTPDVGSRPEEFSSSSDDAGHAPPTYRASGDHEAVDLEAELQKYLQRQEERGASEERSPAPPSASYEPSSQSSSFILDGTWTRDEAPSVPPAPDDGNAAPERPSWLTRFPGEEPSNDAGAAWPASQDETWPASKDWPSEDEWPPREEAV